MREVPHDRFVVTTIIRWSESIASEFVEPNTNLLSFVNNRYKILFSLVGSVIHFSNINSLTNSRSISVCVLIIYSAPP